MPAPGEPHGGALLPPLAADAARAALCPPRLPASSSDDISLAQAAGGVAVPVRLELPATGGRTLLARALHHASGRGGPLVAAEGCWSALGDLPAGASVLIHAEALTPPAVPLLESLIDDGAAWLLVCISDGHPLPAALAPRLEAVTVRVPPLGERRAELPELARHLLRVLHARRGGSPPALMEDAVAHLSARPWPGDIAELEAVLARAMLRADGGPITARHFTNTGALAAAAVAPDTRRTQLEYLVAEMAHELRNPLTTVKTFAQLPGLPENTELRARFAALADDAVTRMNDMLENVLAFARLGTPAPVDVELGPLLDGLLADARPAFAERGIALDYVPANGACCRVDREQIAYAVRNVLAGLSREAPAQDVVRIDAGSAGLVRVDFDDRDGAAARLRRLVLAEHGVDDDRTLLPLVFTLARAVLERNGGTLTMHAGPEGRAALEMRLGPLMTGPAAQGG